MRSSAIFVSLTALALVSCGGDASSSSDQIDSDIASFEVMLAPMFVTLHRVECPLGEKFPLHDEHEADFTHQDYVGAMKGRRYKHEKSVNGQHVDTVYCYEQTASSK